MQNYTACETPLGGFQVRNNLATTLTVCIASFKTIGKLQREKLHQSRAMEGHQLGILSSLVWITLEFIYPSDATDWKQMLLAFAAELPLPSQGTPHENSATRESLRMLHTLCLQVLPSMRRGWNCTQMPCPLFVLRSRTQDPNHKTSWRWWLARAGLMTPTYNNSAYTFWASSRQPERLFFSQI